MGRKTAMDKNGYWLWLQDVMVAYLLAEPKRSIKIDAPVTAHVQGNGILIPLVDLDRMFRRPGVAHFKRWFDIEQGVPGLGISTARMTTDDAVRSEIYDWLVETGTVDLVENSAFVEYERFKRDPEAMAAVLAPFKRWKEKNRALKAAAKEHEPGTAAAYKIMAA